MEARGSGTRRRGVLVGQELHHGEGETEVRGADEHLLVEQRPDVIDVAPHSHGQTATPRH